MWEPIKNKKKLALLAYISSRGSVMWSMEDFIGHAHIRYFGFARHALLEGLIIAGVGKDDKVLLPGFICKELLAVVYSLGAIPLYYQVNPELALSVSSVRLPLAKVVIAVNYFGFPQDITPFKEYCNRTGAVLIEDNAHGLFSKDSEGRFLGTRGDIGIFSLRKTILMPNGAALVINDAKFLSGLKPQIAFSADGEPVMFKVKGIIRKMLPFFGFNFLQCVLSTAEFARKFKPSAYSSVGALSMEFMLPDSYVPCRQLFAYLSSTNVTKEIERRRELYCWVGGIVKNLPCTPTFRILEKHVVPYGFPVYVSSAKVSNFVNLLRTYGLRCIKWPQLPGMINSCAPEYYKNLYLIGFLW